MQFKRTRILVHNACKNFKFLSQQNCKKCRMKSQELPKLCNFMFYPKNTGSTIFMYFSLFFVSKTVQHGLKLQFEFAIL